MLDLFSNPELIRNARAQLRWGRMLAAGGICIALSLTMGFAFSRGADANRPANVWGEQMLQTVFWIQALVLVIGGALMCLNAVHREKEMNTFDFQRVTRLTPLELGLGKLFGTPITAYFVVLCFMPAAIFAAAVGRARPSFVVAAYLVMLVGAVTAHALALMLSIFIPKGTSAGALMLLLFFLFPVFLAPASDSRALYEIGGIAPMNAAEFLTDGTWKVATQVMPKSGAVASANEWTDIFFGVAVHHIPVLLLLYASFTAWFLLAVARNIKRDPAVYEAYSPAQMLCLALYVNFLLIGFFRWKAEPGTWGAATMSGLETQSMFIGINLFLFVVLGLVLMRNRDQARRRLREVGDVAASPAAALWPAPYVVAGTLLTGFAVIGMLMITQRVEAPSDWDLGFAIFRVAFVCVWLSRDLLFLQWMNLTRVRRPLVMGVLYLFVFYFCLGLLFGIFGMFDNESKAVWTALLLPSTVFAATLKSWTGLQLQWMMALVVQTATALLFAFLHRKKLLELAPQAQPAAAPAPPADSSAQFSAGS